MSFVGKIDETAGYPLSLESLKEFMPLADRTTEVEVVMDHEHRCFVFAEIASQGVGAKFSILAGDFPRESAMFVFIEP